MEQPIRTIISDSTATGICAQIVEYQWGPDTLLTQTEHALVAQMRLRPRRIAARVFTEESQPHSLGELSIIPPGIPTYAKTSGVKEVVRAVTCHFDTSWFGILSEDVSLIDHPCFDLPDSDIHGAMLRLGRELANPDGSNSLLVQCIGTETAILITRHLRSRQGGVAHAEPGGMTQQQLKNLYAFIEAFPGAPTLADVAENCALSIGYLQRMFKKSTGRTLYSVLNEARIQRAKTLLAETDLPIKEISYRLHFCEQSAFATAFKKETGETPRNYRMASRWGRVC